MDTKALRQKILDLAIRGKLVPQDPNDEPASVLLERIKAEKERLIKEGKIKRSKKTAKTSDTPHYENVPFEVPEGWKSVPVSELFCLNPKSEITDDTSVGFIPMACVNDGFSGNHQFEERIWKEVKKGYCHFQNGDIGIAKISPCFENLKSTIFQNLPNNYGAGTTELVILRPLNIHAKFYLYLFKSKWYISEGTKYFKGVVGQQRVHKGIFTDLQIPLPPLAEQYRIVAEIEKWFALIDQIEQGKVDLQTIIKQAKSRFLDLAIHGKLVPQNPNDEPAIELLKRINHDFTPCDNEHKWKLPNGWEWIELKKCCHIVGRIGFRGYTKDDLVAEGNGAITLSPSNIIDGKMDYSKCTFISWDKYDESPEIQISCGNILLVKTGSSFGKCALVKNLPQKATINPQFVVLNQISVEKQYLTWVLQSAYARTNYNNFVLGTAIPTFTQAVLGNMLIPLPPLAEQQRIVQKIEELFSVLDNIQKALEV